MATVTTVILSDSLDERIKNGVETVTFFHPVTGVKMEIELGEANRSHFANHLQKLDKYFDAATVVEPPVKATKPAVKADSELAKVRKWAQDNGYAVGDRGRIKSEIVEAYHKAQTPRVEQSTEEQAAEVNDLIDSETVVDTEDAGVEIDVLVSSGEPTDEEIMAMMAEIEAENGEVTEESLKAALDSDENTN